MRLRFEGASQLKELVSHAGHRREADWELLQRAGGDVEVIAGTRPPDERKLASEQRIGEQAILLGREADRLVLRRRDDLELPVVDGRNACIDRQVVQSGDLEPER